MMALSAATARQRIGERKNAFPIESRPNHAERLGGAIYDQPPRASDVPLRGSEFAGETPRIPRRPARFAWIAPRVRGNLPTEPRPRGDAARAKPLNSPFGSPACAVHASRRSLTRLDVHRSPLPPL